MDTDMQSGGNRWHLVTSRRHVLKGALAASGVLLLGSGACNRGRDAESISRKAADRLTHVFPKKFLWGAGTSGLQHEGSPLAHGAGPSMMYTWAHTSGKVPENGTFDVSADFYRRFRSDIQLMRDLNLQSYNFEVYWPRIFPDGTGKVNKPGLDFYDQLVDEFLAAGIVPLCNLFVFDHPQAVQDRGGWLNRDCASWFADYSSAVFDRLGDRVRYWTTICEIQIINHNSYATGEFPPEAKNLSASLRANHHLLLGQGLAVQAFRASGAKGEIGNQHLVIPITPASDSDKDQAAARRADAYFNLLATDPQMRGEYPAELITWLGETWPHDAISDGDLDAISTPMDFFGMDYYLDFSVSDGFPGAAEDDVAGAALDVNLAYTPPSGNGLRDALVWVRDRYGSIPIHLLEIGIHLEDTVVEGVVDDPERIAYFHDLLTGAHRAIDEGVDLRSCFIWSFLDGWEFNAGLSYRYGLVHVDFETQERTVKSSALWYRDVIAANGLTDLRESSGAALAP